MRHQAIDVKPISGAMGADILGVDLSSSLGDSELDEIRQAFLNHKVIRFRDQNLTPALQIAFARQFGQPDIYPFLKNIEGFPEVIELIKTETDTANFGSAWHSDTAYLARPALGTMLYALETPTAGGDTLFANMNLAYEALSDGIKKMIAPLIGVNSSGLTRRVKSVQAMDGMRNKYIANANMSVAEHPVVRTHPETGQKALYLSRGHTGHFKGMTPEESKPLIDFLSIHAVRLEFTCRISWEPGTLVFWDNRCTQHFAVNDYNGQRRRMHRVTLIGDRPA